MTKFQDGLKAGATCATVLIGFAIACLPAAAQPTYVYTGSNFTAFRGSLTGSDHLSATMQLTNPLPPNQFCIDPSGLPGFSLTMTDGKTGTAAWPGFPTFRFVRVSTDATGAIIKPWLVSLEFIDNAGRDRILRTLQSTAPCVGTYSQELSDLNGGSAADYGVGTTAGVWSAPPPTVNLTMLKTQFQLGILPDAGSSFGDQLQQILNDISAGNGLACQDLQGFANHVRAQAGKKLSQEQADSILQTVASIAAALNCSI